MIKCTTCGTDNLDGSQYCDECGNQLKAKSVAIQNEQAMQAASATSVGIPLIIEEPPQVVALSQLDTPSSMAKSLRAKLVIEKGVSAGAEFNLSSDESQIGRWDADNGIFPDVDLDAFDPEAKISRRHARIIFDNGKYMVEDLGSTNGTFVNRGRRLLPGTPHVLNDGDEIIVGKTFLRFFLT